MRPLFLIACLALSALLQGCATAMVVTGLQEGPGRSCSSNRDTVTFAGLNPPVVFEVEKVGVNVRWSRPVHSVCWPGLHEGYVYTIDRRPGCRYAEDEPDTLVLWKIVGSQTWIEQGSAYSKLLGDKPSGYTSPPTPVRGQAVLLADSGATSLGAWNRSPDAPLLWIRGRRLFWKEPDGLASSVLSEELYRGKECSGIPRGFLVVLLPPALAADVLTSPLQFVGIMILSGMGVKIF